MAAGKLAIMELGEPLHALNIVSGCRREGRSLHPQRQTDGHQSVPCASASRTVGQVLGPGGMSGNLWLAIHRHCSCLTWAFLRSSVAMSEEWESKNRAELV